MRILCVGLNHKTAPVSIRERVSYSPAQARAALETLRDRHPRAAMLLLSTCNRTELYVSRPLHGRPREEEVREFLGGFHGVGRDDYDGALYVHADAEAARHLFAVAAGLDSLVPGEEQVLGQVKQAYRLAQSARVMGPELDELCQLALAAAREVRASTGIAAGKVSVASVAVEQARQVLGDLAGRCVLSVGAGKMNALMLRRLRGLGAGPIRVANRSPARAAQAAEDCGGQVVAFGELAGALAEADLAVCSTAADQPVVTAAMVAKAMAGRSGRPLLLLDIAVPRDVAEAAGSVPGVTLYNIDDLKAVVERNVDRRSAKLDAAGEIIDRRVAEYVHRRHVREVAPTIEQLYRQMRRVADEEVAAAAHKLTGDADADRQRVRRAIHRALRRILHTPMTNLRAGAGTEAARRHAAILRQLFDLPPEEP